MLRLLVLLSALLYGYIVEADRVTNGLVAEYDFLSTQCSAGVFSNKVSGGVGSAVSMLSDKTFACQSATVGGITFPNAANGIQTTNTANVAGVRSQAGVLTSSLANGFTVELWLKGNNAAGNEVVFELSKPFSETQSVLAFGSQRYLTISIFQNRQIFVDFNIGDTRSLTLDITSASDIDENIGPYHLLITCSTTPMSCSAFKQASLIDSEKTSPNSLVFESGFTDPNLIFGGSYLTSSLGGGGHNGIVLLSAFYSRRLINSDIISNFNAGLKNNAPVGFPMTLPKVEDVNLPIIFTANIFDFDNVASQTDILSVKLASVPQNGQLFIGNLLQGVDSVVTNNLVYVQNTPNEDSITDSFTFTVSDGKGGVSAPVVVTLPYQEANDAPVATGIVLEVSEFKTRQFNVEVADPLDDGVNKNNSFLPQKIRITGITNSVGTYFDCNGAFITGLKVNDEVPVTSSSTINGVFKGIVCIEYVASGSEIPSAGALVGTDNMQFVAVDGPGLTSAQAVATVNVVSALAAGCPASEGVDKVNCQSSMEEFIPGESNDSVEIKLQSFDSRCDIVVNGNVERDANAAGCGEGEREKAYIIIGPVPDPETEGVLKALSADGTEFEEITKAALGDAGFEIKNNRDSVFFFPVANYFNVARFPVCVNNNAAVPQSDCANNGNPLQLTCVGPLCTGEEIPYTTIAKNESRFALYQECSKADAIDGGCPIQIFHRLKVGAGSNAGLSPLASPATPTHTIWVKNTLQDEIFDDTLFLATSYGPFARNGKKVLSSTEPIRVDDPDTDAKNMQISLTFSLESIQLSLSTSTLGNNPEDSHFLAREGCFGQGCKFTETGRLTGLSSGLNRMLRGLELQTLDVAADVFSVEITLDLTVPFKKQATGVIIATRQYVISADIGDGNVADDDPNFFRANPQITAALVAVGLIIILCLCAAFRTGTRLTCFGYKFGRRAARKLGRAQNVRKNRAENFEEEIKPPTMWNYLCPCCCPLDEETRERLKEEQEINEKNADLRKQYGQRNVADFVQLPKSKRRNKNDDSPVKSRRDLAESSKKSKEVVTSQRSKQVAKSMKTDSDDIMNWERHATVKNGKETFYYYNTVTDESQWESPYPGKNIRRGKAKDPEPKQQRFAPKAPPPKSERSDTVQSRRGDSVQSARGKK